MSSKEIKKQLIDKILSTDDHSILEEVYRILEVSTQEIDTIMLTDNQKSEIDKGIRDIEEGRYLTNEAANTEIIEWLKK
jgi:predicted transcriptional regulator